MAVTLTEPRTGSSPSHGFALNPDTFLRRPVLALRFNYEDQTMIQEDLSGATCLLGTDPGPDPADPTFLFGGEPLRTGRPH